MHLPPRLPAEHPCILSVSGDDALRFLSGQLTRDLRELEDRAVASCVTDAKGRLQHLVQVCTGPTPGDLWVTCPPDQGDDLRGRLERYLIADDAEITDRTGDWCRIHVAERPADLPVDFTRRAHGPFGEGFDLWWQAGTEPRWPAPDLEALEDQRIAAGIPAWGRELLTGMLPPEAGLDRTAISYTKGCYIGQEVLSRIKSAGRLNRRLALFQVDGDARPGDRLAVDGVPVGSLTSVARPPAPGAARAALGYLSKQAFDAVEFPLLGPDDTVTGRATREAWA